MTAIIPSSVTQGRPRAIRSRGWRIAGELKLQFKAPRGYLDSLLQVLGIDPGSQTLVYSKSSLQVDRISAATPRAIYFNDNVYVAYVQGGPIEIVTMDNSLGPVFYTLANRPDVSASVDREVLRCLACHDKFSLAGGGVPLFLIMSTKVDINGLLLEPDTSAATTDQTPLRDRWGGWFVSGRQGSQVHLGNLLIQSKDEVFEHQATVHNQITRVNCKARNLVARTSQGQPEPASWGEVPAKIRPALQKIVEPLVDALLFVDAAPFTDKIQSTSGFDRWFQAQGPRDPQGRSLPELDLQTRLLKYPLSYLVYSEAFDALPAYARDYVYERLIAVLSDQDRSTEFARLSAEDRTAITSILRATKPEFAQALDKSQPAGQG